MARVLIIILTISSFLFTKELKDITLQLKWKYQFQFAGYIAAKEKGFYRNIGLNVTLKEYEKYMNIVDEVVTGNAQYGISAPTSMIDISKGKKVVYLATIFQSSPLILLADKSSNIKSIKDFKNKRMMTTGDGSTDISLLSMIYSQKVSFDDIKIQPPSFNPKDLLDKKTDLLSSYISNEPYTLKKLGGEPVVFDPKDYGFDFYEDIIIVDEKYMNNYSEEVKKFKEATLKGWEYAFSNIDEIIEIILKKYNTQNKTKEALKYEAGALKKLAYFQTDQIGKIENEKLEKMYDLYKILGLVRNNINFNKVVFNEFSLNLELTENEKKYLEQKASISMCIDPNWMPLEKFDKKGNYIGISADYFALFEKILQVKFNVVYTKSWDQSLEFAKQRKCDVLSLVMQTPSRKKYLNFTSPYLSIPLVFATRINMPFINDVNGLIDKKIAIPKGYAYRELLKDKYPFLKIVDVKNEKEGLQLVKQNQVDVYVGTLATVGYILQNEYIGELKIAGKFNEDWSLGIGVRGDDIMLLQVLQKAVNNIEYDQQREILNKWIAIKYEQGFNYNLLYKILLVVFVIVLFMLYKQYMLKKSINEFGELIDSTLEAIFLSRNGICVDVNQSAVELCGYSSKKEIIGKNLYDFISTDSYDIVKKNIILTDSIPYEASLLRKDGTVFPALLRGRELPSKNLRVSSAIDLTQVKQLEGHAKLASMGEMIGNISHQWRQPLSVISTAVTGIKVQKEYGKEVSDEELLSFCNHISDNVQYLSQTIDDFKNFIKGDSEPTLFNLQKTIDSFINIIEPTMKVNQIRVIVNIEDSIELIGYPNELIQCCINIFNNSKDALLHNKVLEEDRIIFINQKKEQDSINLSFLDTAGGIPKDIIKRVFEPYFTTKHRSQGTGLGLHMSYNLIVNSMKGNIKVYNHTFNFETKKYRGANFVIELPLNKVVK